MSTGENLTAVPPSALITGDGWWVADVRVPPGFVIPAHEHEWTTYSAALTGSLLCEAENFTIEQPGLTLGGPSKSHFRNMVAGPMGLRTLIVSVSQSWVAEAGFTPTPTDELSCSLPQAKANLRLWTSMQDKDMAGVELAIFETLAEMEHCATPMETRTPRWYRNLTAKISASYREPLRIKSLAKDAGVHPVHLSRTFKSKHGRSLSQHIEGLRALEAARLIADGASAGEACFEVGYTDQANLNRGMRRALGTTPSQLKSLRS